MQLNRNSLPNAITPYYASLLDRTDPSQRSAPHHGDGASRSSHGLLKKPSIRWRKMPTARCQALVHRYPDRVLFLVTGHLPGLLPYCTRSRMVGSQDGGIRVQHHAVGTGASTTSPRHRSSAMCCCRAAIRSVMSDDRLGVAAVAASPHQARRVPSHRQQGSRRASAARSRRR